MFSEGGRIRRPSSPTAPDFTDTTAVITTITEKAVISEARATALMAVVPKTIIIAEFVALGITEDSTREGFLICGALIRDFARASAV